MHKNKGHNYYYSTSERQSSYNQNNFIFLMKFNTNRNNVSIEDNFQVSSFTAFRLNNLIGLKRSVEEIYDASAAVLIKGLLHFKPAG
jgi:hypothetical protein